MPLYIPSLADHIDNIEHIKESLDNKEQTDAIKLVRLTVEKYLNGEAIKSKLSNDIIMMELDEMFDYYSPE